MTTEAALTPKLTRFDKRVLRALEEWPDDWRLGQPLQWLNAWQIAERLGEYDVGTVCSTLRGLQHLGYITGRDWGKKQRWIRLPQGTEAMA